MSSRSADASRMPRDVHLRERLRAAQQAEAQALRAVDRALAARASACARRDAAVAAASRGVDLAGEVVAEAQANLARISGVDRAAVLLGVDRRELRKAIAGQAGGGNDSR